MDTLTKIRKQWIAKRKDDSLVLPTASFIALVVSECERVGKDDGNRQPTEQEVQRVIKKLHKGIDESLRHQESVEGVDNIDAMYALNLERSFLEAFMPKVMSESELRVIIDSECDKTNVGETMKYLKGKYGSSVDLKLASSIIRE